MSIRVLVVDDAKWSREMIGEMLNKQDGVEVVGLAANAFEAKRLLEELHPDVMILDIVMPGMDGLTFLSKIKERLQAKVIVLSGISENNSEYYFKALELGAVDVLKKPVRPESLITLVKSIGRNRAKIAAPKSGKIDVSKVKLVGMASSTGGPMTLRHIFSMIQPIDIPIVLVQHMPAHSMKAFANSLQEVCPMPIHLASNGHKLVPGQVVIAPGDYHLQLKSYNGAPICHLISDPPILGIRPAADYLFSSMAKHFGAKSMGIILTGMGSDGAKGMSQLKQAGGLTIGQNEKSCVVYGMPHAAKKLEAIQHDLSPMQIAGILNICKKLTKIS